MKKAVLYFRVSLKKQIHGMEVQTQFVNSYLRQTGKITLRTYYEIESGYDDDRPQLEKPIRYCERTGATLIFSTMSRLSRHALLVAGLMIQRIRFIAADKPYADDLDNLEDAIEFEREWRRIRYFMKISRKNII